MTKNPKLQGPTTEAPPKHPHSGGRWIRAADGSLSREAVKEDSTAPDDAAPATEEAR